MTRRQYTKIKMDAPTLARILGPLVDGGHATAKELGFNPYHLDHYAVSRGIVKRVSLKLKSGRGRPNIVYEITPKGKGIFNLVRQHYKPVIKQVEAEVGVDEAVAKVA